MKYVIALLILGLGLAAAQAEHATISLRVLRFYQSSDATDDSVEAKADQEPPQGGIVSRPLFKAKAKEPLVLQFFFINTYPHGVNKDVTVRYYVVREEKIKQKAVPDPKDGCVIQGDFHLNFKPKSRVGARVSFSVPEPGNYLLRVDSLNTSNDHEHFSAIDLQVE
jgi:hypothetical protein